MADTITEYKVYKPLDLFSPDVPSGAKSAFVLDGAGREYFRAATDNKLEITVAGALGTHQVLFEDESGAIVGTETFRVDCETSIEDQGEWNTLFRKLRWNIFKGREFKVVRYKEQPHFLFSDWLRDHVHILKGKKYFFPHIKDAIEVFGKSQKENGMLYDFLMPHNPQAKGTLDRFHDASFMELIEGDKWLFERVPVENDVEYLFVEGLYYTWKATGDSSWMQKWLPSAQKALEYSVNDPLRWSEKMKLLKRGYTIDTWDFQSEEDTARTGDTMDIVHGKTHFGIMHGDNTGYATSCRYLAEMLEYTNQKDAGQRWRERGRQILRQLTKVAWNGSFFNHHVPEDPSVDRDLGVDEKQQVSLSNTYALNRDISHEQAVAIIRTYQRLRDERPASSPGEFYAIYPPFQKGFGGHGGLWHYMNGGVFPFIAGELSHGSFTHGFENYAVQILRRIHTLIDEHGDELPYYWLGAIEPPPERSFTKLSLESAANVHFSGTMENGVPGWTGQGSENDLSHIPVGDHLFHDIPFTIIDPSRNDKKACIGMADKEGFYREIDIPVNRHASSIYFLHTSAGNGVAGIVDIYYEDGSETRKYVTNGSEIRNWWNPVDVPYNRRKHWCCRVAWEGRNKSTNVGVYQWGFDNPHPTRQIKKIVLRHSLQPGYWFILGITLSDVPYYMKPQDAIYGWLENWNAAALFYAMIEGMAGIKDCGVAFDRIQLSPRWIAAGVDNVIATARYEVSGAYVRYHYNYNSDSRKIRVELATCGKKIEIRLLLPPQCKNANVLVDGESIASTITAIEKSLYLCFSVEGIKAHTIEVEM